MVLGGGADSGVRSQQAGQFGWQSDGASCQARRRDAVPIKPHPVHDRVCTRNKAARVPHTWCSGPVRPVSASGSGPWTMSPFIAAPLRTLAFAAMCCCIRACAYLPASGTLYTSISFALLFYFSRASDKCSRRDPAVLLPPRPLAPLRKCLGSIPRGMHPFTGTHQLPQCAIHVASSANPQPDRTMCFPLKNNPRTHLRGSVMSSGPCHDRTTTGSASSSPSPASLMYPNDQNPQLSPPVLLALLSSGTTRCRRCPLAVDYIATTSHESRPDSFEHHVKLLRYLRDASEASTLDIKLQPISTKAGPAWPYSHVRKDCFLKTGLNFTLRAASSQSWKAFPTLVVAQSRLRSNPVATQSHFPAPLT
ncbi:hypothetical protein PSPO01_03854 [Paraphaeosphaeria sporulosa]